MATIAKALTAPSAVTDPSPMTGMTSLGGGSPTIARAFTDPTGLGDHAFGRIEAANARRRTGSMGSLAPSSPPGGTAGGVAFQRPAAVTPPAWLQFDPVMSNLQRRSYIATQGISGNQGLYRSDEAKNYYKNLLGQDFISPLGQAQGDLTGLLPIEQQYLQALGVPQFSDVSSLLKGLGY